MQEVIAQLAKGSVLTPELSGSNPSISQIIFESQGAVNQNLANLFRQLISVDVFPVEPHVRVVLDSQTGD